MGQCFATGSRRGNAQLHPLKVLHSVEYLRYDTGNARVELAGDFFVQNQSTEAAPLRGLHPGSVRFTGYSEDWLADARWTELLKQVAADQIGLKIGANRQMSLHQAGKQPMRVHVLPGELGDWWPASPLEDGYAPFTGWTSPPVPPDDVYVFRVCGNIQGETYRRLMPANPATQPIKILGGAPLRTKIKADLGESTPADVAALYGNAFADFEENWLADPDFYHVLFERADDRPFKPIYVSPETWRGCLNRSFQGRTVSWYWSDTELNIDAKANGPVLEFVAGPADGPA